MVYYYIQYDVVEGRQPEKPAIGYGPRFPMMREYDDNGTPKLVKIQRENRLKSFYKAAFDCRLKENSGNTQLLDIFMDYLCDSAKLCVVKDNGNGEICYNKNKIREMMGDRYIDDNESIDYNIDIISNDGNKIESKCISPRRRKSNGCIVIKEEYDTCLFNLDGSIKEFKVNRSNRRTECKDDNNNDYVRIN